MLIEEADDKMKPKIKKRIQQLINDHLLVHKLDEEKVKKSNKQLVKSIIDTKHDVKLCIYNESKDIIK